MPDLSGLPDAQVAFMAADADSRRQHAAAQQRKAEEDFAAAAAELRKRLVVGEVVPVDDGTAVVLKPGPSGRRSVNQAAVHEHIEALGPIGLGPAERTKVSVVYPTIAELERRQDDLARAGIPVHALITVPPAGEPEVVIVALEAVA